MQAPIPPGLAPPGASALTAATRLGFHSFVPRGGRQVHRGGGWLRGLPAHAKVPTMASRVIKPPEHSRVGASTDELRADQIVRQAKVEARRIRQQAEAEAQAAIADAQVRGEQDGIQSAVAYQELAQQVAGQLSTGLDRDALEAAVDATHEVVAAEFSHRPSAIVDVVKRALGNAKHQREIFVRVNPKDAAVLREHKRELLDVLTRARDVDIREDAAMQPGGCLVETEIGMVDADIKTQLERLSRMLLGGA